MSTARSRMTHRCRIERDPSGVNDAGGYKEDPDWDLIYVDQPCFLVRTSARERNGDEVIAITQTRLLIPLSVDVDEKDRVVDIRDRLDNLVLEGVYNIKAVEIRPLSHKELTLEKYGPLSRA